MQFKTLLFTAFMAAFVQTGLACNLGQDCCWGGKDNGLSGCENQHRPSDPCYTASYEGDFCRNRGVTAAQCDADCCSISRKIGIACP